MVDTDLLEQLIYSMQDALNKLEKAFLVNDINYINRLRVFIFNIHQQIDGLLLNQNV